MKRSITIKDVAARARVSVGTVSAVLNNHDTVSALSRARVLKGMEDLSYQPKNNARSLKYPRPSAIGLIVPDLQNPFFSSIAEGVQIAAEKHDILLVLCLTASRHEREQYYAQALQTARLDGIIYLSGSGMPSEGLLRLERSQQIVLVDETVPGVEIPFVSSRNRAGACALAKHLLSFNHKSVGIIGGPPRLWTSEQRLSGYREAIVSAGLDPDEMPMLSGDYGEASGYQVARQIFSQNANRGITALLCSNDLMAIGAMRYCREAGLRIPSDISIIGFDDIPSSSLVRPALTTVAQPGHEMGQAAALLLLHQIKGIEPPASVEFATRLCLRESVGRSPVR